MTRVGILGHGFMGRTHAAGYAAAGARCRVVAVAEKADHALGLLDRTDIDAVSICTYTDTHVPLALEALRRGKHVLVEKPVALRSAEVDALAAAARASERICMPAMCMRFWPGWPWLRERIRDHAFGAVRQAAFIRMGARPAWGAAFYLDERRSGGALFDLHIHDTDFIWWCFGNPETVESRGTSHDLTTLYRVPGGPELRARGAWLPDPGAAFTMQYEVEFEQAVVRFDLTKAPVVTVERGGRPEAPDVGTGSAYDAEITHFLDLVQGQSSTPVATLEDAATVTRILEAEAESLRLSRGVAPARGGR